MLALGLASCSDSPKVIEAEPIMGGTAAEAGGGAGGGNAPAMPAVGQAPDQTAHTVTALEILQAERYTYVRVKENDQEHWVAIPK